MEKGFNNIGNSCFFNSALQLLKIPLYNIITKYQLSLSSNNDIYNSIIDLFNSIYNDSNYNSSYKSLYIFFMTKFKYSIFSQQDSSEVIQFILDTINDILPTKKNTCIAWNQIISCNLCNKYKIYNTQYDNILYSYTLNTSNSNNKYMEFENFLQETLNQTNITNSDFKCNCNNSNNIYIQHAITHLPQYLFINIARYNNSIHKNSTSLEIANIFNITTPVNLIDKINNSNNNYNNNIYKLIGIVVHHGNSLNGGHYITYLKINNNWKLFNDNHVSDIDLNLYDESIMKNACILLYQL